MSLLKRVRNKPGVNLVQGAVAKTFISTFESAFAATLIKKYSFRRIAFNFICVLLWVCLTSSAVQYGAQLDTSILLGSASIVCLVMLVHSGALIARIERLKHGDYKLDVISLTCAYKSIAFSLPVPEDKVNENEPFKEEELQEYRNNLLSDNSIHRFLLVDILGYCYCFPDLSSDCFMMNEDEVDDGNFYSEDVITCLYAFLEVVKDARQAHVDMVESIRERAEVIESQYQEYVKFMPTVPTEVEELHSRFIKLSDSKMLESYLMGTIKEDKDDAI